MYSLFVTVSLVITPLLSGPSPQSPESPVSYSELSSFITARTGEFKLIPAERRKELESLAGMIRSSLKENDRVSLTFICTHNSRRSHMSQIWAAAAARHYGIDNVHVYSGGTERTAFNPRAVAAMERAGFHIDKTTDDADPIYHVRYAEDAQPLTCFSKVYDQAPNPKKDFIAVMVCSNADRGCPNVKGASHRIAIPFEDPKIADGTPGEAAKYDERCRQIAREFLYAFSKVK